MADLMVSLSELARRMGRSDRTVRRWLRRKGIRAEGFGVHLSVLQARWPMVYAGITGDLAVIPTCTTCGVQATCSCPVCGETVRFVAAKRTTPDNSGHSGQKPF